MISKYYLDNQEAYVRGFASFLTALTDHQYTKQEYNKIFKDYMLDYKNIKVDMRLHFWKRCLYLAIQRFNGGNTND